MAGGQLPFGFAPQGELTAYEPTLREKAADWLRQKLFTDDRAGQDKANRLVNWGETMLPPFGFATSAYDAGRAGGEGNYGKAGFLTAMAMVPGYHGSPIKGLTKLEKRYGRNPVFLAVDDGTPRPREYASGYAGDEGQVYSAKFDDANVLDARTPEGRASLVSALDETYPLGGDFYLWEKGVKEGQLPGWGDDMLFRSLEKAGHKGALINERPDVVSAAIFDPSIIEMQPQGVSGAIDALQAKYPNVKLDISSGSTGLTLSRIEVPKGERSKGVGTAVMNDLADIADANGLPVALSPSSDFGGSVSRLKDFYKRFGFVPNKGRNKDFTISESYIRLPKSEGK